MALEWNAVFVFLAVAAAFTGLFWGAAKLLGVRARHKPPLQDETYECGEEAVGDAWIQFNPRYYVVALVFVLFDVEAALLFPWALQVKSMGLAALLAGAVFLGVLMLGWLYAVRKGALVWR